MAFLLLSFPRYSGIDDEGITPFLLFLFFFFDAVQDIMFEIESNSEFLELAKGYTTALVNRIGAKLRAPTPSEWYALDRDEKRGFQDFRAECREVLQGSFRIIGIPMVTNLATVCANSANQQNWGDVE